MLDCATGSELTLVSTPFASVVQLELVDDPAGDGVGLADTATVSTSRVGSLDWLDDPGHRDRRVADRRDEQVGRRLVDLLRVGQVEGGHAAADHERGDDDPEARPDRLDVARETLDLAVGRPPVHGGWRGGRRQHFRLGGRRRQRANPRRRAGHRTSALTNRPVSCASRKRAGASTSAVCSSLAAAARRVGLLRLWSIARGIRPRPLSGGPPRRPPARGRRARATSPRAIGPPEAVGGDGQLSLFEPERAALHQRIDRERMQGCGAVEVGERLPRVAVGRVRRARLVPRGHPRGGQRHRGQRERGGRRRDRQPRWPRRRRRRRCWMAHDQRHHQEADRRPGEHRIGLQPVELPVGHEVGEHAERGRHDGALAGGPAA